MVPQRARNLRQITAATIAVDPLPTADGWAINFRTLPTSRCRLSGTAALIERLDRYLTKYKHTHAHRETRNRAEGSPDSRVPVLRVLPRQRWLGKSSGVCCSSSSAPVSLGLSMSASLPKVSSGVSSGYHRITLPADMQVRARQPPSFLSSSSFSSSFSSSLILVATATRGYRWKAYTCIDIVLARGHATMVEAGRN